MEKRSDDKGNKGLIVGLTGAMAVGLVALSLGVPGQDGCGGEAELDSAQSEARGGGSTGGGSRVDPCSDPNLNNCDANAICTSKAKSYTCTCKATFLGDGYTCAPQTTASAVISSAGGSLEIPNGPLAGLRLTIPAGALAQDTAITLKTGDLNQNGATLGFQSNPALFGDAIGVLDEMFGGWSDRSHLGTMLTLESLGQTGAQPVGTLVILEPAGLTFSIPATLDVPYVELTTGDDPVVGDSAQWLTATHSSSTLPMRLISPLAVDTNRKMLRFEIGHFSEIGISNFFRRLGESTVAQGAAQAANAKALLQGAYRGYMRSVSTTTDVLEAFADTALTRRLARDLARKLACRGAGIDLSIPVGAGSLLEMLGALMMSGAPVFSLDLDSVDTVLRLQQTGAEGAYLDGMLARDTPASFADAFDLALDLNNNNAYLAFMTMHNVGQAIARPGPHVAEWTDDAVNKVTTELLPHMAPMTDIDPRITDTRGAWYHAAGLAALSMRTGEGLPMVMATVDEALYSGLLGGHFSLGEQIANMIGSVLGPYLKEQVALTAANPSLCIPPAPYWFCTSAAFGCHRAAGPFCSSVAEGPLFQNAVDEFVRIESEPECLGNYASNFKGEVLNLTPQTKYYYVSGQPVAYTGYTATLRISWTMNGVPGGLPDIQDWWSFQASLPYGATVVLR
ncbi:MAG: hypothetical protein HYV07_28805 [Deltaproteobacteria bacterium]|nr:hypothetical protein [Deltaproteobacteria bacterium]